MSFPKRFVDPNGYNLHFAKCVKQLLLCAGKASVWVNHHRHMRTVKVWGPIAPELQRMICTLAQGMDLKVEIKSSQSRQWRPGSTRVRIFYKG